MGALNPLFLLAGIAVAIPLWLHLFQRHETRRVSFPALRYLERTEREHARMIRLRQILLMLARIVVLLLLVGAGARLFFGGRGASHPPTAVVLVLDNSLSSGLVVGEVRVLDELKRLAGTTLDGATDDDRFWLIRAGEPWIPALPGSAADVRISVDETEPSEAAGDVTAALERAARLLQSSTLPRREIHLFSDLQATAFAGSASPRPAGEIPVIVWTGHEAPEANRALASVVVGGGLPPLEGQRTEVTVTALEAQSEADSVHVPLRLVVNERIRGAATLPPGSQTTIALPPSGSGWVQGYVDADPDALRADDRRFFAYRSRPAPGVDVAGDPGVFVDEALGVLEGAARVRQNAGGPSEVLFSSAGSGLDVRGPTTATLVIPPSDPALLPALNRQLADAGIPWTVAPANVSGEGELAGVSLPEPLEGVRIRRRYELRLAGDPPGPTRTLAEVEGEAWAVEGVDTEGRRYLLLGSALDARGTTLPVSTGMLRFVDWVASEWAGAGGGGASLLTGESLSAPAGATHVRFPDGTEVAIDGTRTVRGAGQAGFYTFLEADTAVSVVAVNPPVAESRLRVLAGDDLQAALGDDVTEVRREGGWDRAIFRVRQGPELWWPFLLAALVLLLVESLMATSGERSLLSFRRDSQTLQADGIE